MEYIRVGGVVVDPVKVVKIQLITTNSIRLMQQERLLLTL